MPTTPLVHVLHVIMTLYNDTVCVYAVTLGRALELGHKPTVVSALAAETAQQFTIAGDALKTLDPAQFLKWSSYLALKAAFYESYVSGLIGRRLHCPLPCINLPSICRTHCCLLRVLTKSLSLCRLTVSLARSCWCRRSAETLLKCCSTVRPVRTHTL